MKVGQKILLISSLGLLAVAAAAFWNQRNSIREDGIEGTRDLMSSMVSQAKEVRDEISRLNELNAFDRDHLREELKQHTDYHDAAIYRTIPIVAAWESIEAVAEEADFNFRVVKNKPRNPDHTPTAREVEILAALAADQETDFFEVDRASNSVVYGAPILASRDCLHCHGDPKDSRTGDGRDMLGFKMENWEVGSMQGAFILEGSLDKVDSMIAERTMAASIKIFPLTLLTIIALGFVVRRWVERPINESVSKVRELCAGLSANAGEISSANEQIAANASQQAAAVEETTASAEELRSTVRQNRETADGAEQEGRRTANSAMETARGADTMAQAIREGEEASRAISKVISSIEEIAFQTNLLALNASVEAARAGEAGAGFAVVADEVRALSQRSTQAARESARLIEDAIEKTARGQQESAQVVEALKAIESQSQHLAERIHEVAMASQQQEEGIQQIATAMHEIDRSSQSSAASSEETAAAAMTIRQRVESLAQAVVSLEKVTGVRQEGTSPLRETRVRGNSQGNGPNRSAGVLPAQRRSAPVLMN